MVDYVVSDRSGRFTEDITENIIQFQVRDGKAVLGPILSPGHHICKFGTVADQVTQLTDLRRRNKAWLDHVTHK